MKKIPGLDTLKWIAKLTDRQLIIVVVIFLGAGNAYQYNEKKTAAKDCDQKFEAFKAGYSDIIVPVFNKMTKDDQYQVLQIDSLKSELQKLVNKTNAEIKKFKK